MKKDDITLLCSGRLRDSTDEIAVMLVNNEQVLQLCCGCALSRQLKNYETYINFILCKFIFLIIQNVAPKSC